MDLYKNFELHKGKFYLRDEVEGFRNLVLKKIHEIETKQEIDAKNVEQVTTVLEEFGLYCNDPYQLPTILREQLKNIEKVESLNNQIEEFKQREGIIQKSIFSAQKMADEILENARSEENRIIEEAKRREIEIHEKIDYYLNEIVKEQVKKVDRVSKEIEVIKEEMTSFLFERLDMLNNDMSLDALKEMASSIEKDIEDIKLNIWDNEQKAVKENVVLEDEEHQEFGSSDEYFNEEEVI